LWAALVVLPALVSLAVSPPAFEPGFDWTLVGKAFDRWQATGSPYRVPPTFWDPCVVTPYLYPPSSWPLLALAKIVPFPVLALGLVPAVARPPRWWLAPVAVALMVVGLPSAFYLGNVNLLIVGLLVASFAPGRIGGIAFAAAVGIKGYPIVLLPFLVADRERVRWFAGVLIGLVVSGTVLFPSGWGAVALTLLRQGPHCDQTLNPFADVGFLRVIPAAGLIVLGWRLRSPAVALIGATFFGGVVSRHYAPTIASVLAFEGTPAVRVDLRGTRNRKRMPNDRLLRP
jgi:hypothetical protein